MEVNAAMWVVITHACLYNFRLLLKIDIWMSVAVYNTLTRKKETFQPLDPQRVVMYVCGPTVYNYAHIGNARPAVIFDLWRRVLERHYPEVVYARNITDVDDKINKAAAEQQVPISVISERYTQAYLEDMGAIGVNPPTIAPKATDHIDDIIAMIENLITQGNAYEAEQHVLFDVESFSEYGRLSRRDMREMIAGARVEVAPYKRNPADFVLWKPSTEDQPGWNSPWGYGRPGWHIECSAMAAKHLGKVIDIHGGGQDLVFPHHENEVAQSRCAHGESHFARYWLHNGFVQMDSRKMSKSLGNVLTVHELLKQWPGEVLRYVLLSAHYRQPLDWSEQALQQARKTLDRLYVTLRDHGLDELPDADIPEAMAAALDDDLNTPKALAELNTLARQLANAGDDELRGQLTAQIKAGGQLMGLLTQSPEEWFAAQKSDVDAEKIDQMIADRNAARAGKDFATADRLRDELTDMGVIIEDGPEGTTWRVE